MKSAVLVVALVAARRASAGSRGGYGKRKRLVSSRLVENDFLLWSPGYSDVTLHVLEWITYLKRLSLIALMLCAVVLYYVPKSRSHARRVCCALIDFIADGLKSVLSITEIKYEHIMAGDQDDKNKEPRIQKQCGKLFKENANGRGQKCADKINIHGHRSMSTSKESRRKQQWRKSRTKRSIDGEHERHRLHSHHHRNAAIKDVSSESGATITPTAYEHEKVTSTVQRQSRRNCTSSILSKQLADPYYGEALTTRDSYERLQRENHRFLLSMKKIVDDCSYENAPIIKNRAKPVLLRVFNWLFSGCPEASRRRREQVEVVGKEGTVECTNAWLR
ncbi:hypothetical protein DMN91_009334 [Ooceraea biroi]|uniref:Uncharacterized protein n=1 Tax=Ooceraea biroi TaxID=2015173 RepID=A0A3L8DFA2_OOCBI|nr:hypothetical protein DMN91_009334 [Ooceraea biroi]